MPSISIYKLNRQSLGIFASKIAPPKTCIPLNLHAVGGLIVQQQVFDFLVKPLSFGTNDPYPLPISVGSTLSIIPYITPFPGDLSF
jgi:hypothetical protein